MGEVQPAWEPHICGLLKLPFQKDPEDFFSCISKPSSTSIWRYPQPSSFPFPLIPYEWALIFVWAIPWASLGLSRPCALLILTRWIHCIFWDGLEGTDPLPKAAQCHHSHAITSLASCRSVPSDSTAPTCTMAMFTCHCCSLKCFHPCITSDITAKSTEFWSCGWAACIAWGTESCCTHRNTHSTTK